MGFKHQTKLQRLQNIEIMCTEKSNQSLIKASDPVEPQAPKVTDFSINRILSEDSSLKSDKLKQDKNNTILDLSKHAAPTHSEDYAQQYPVPMYNYGALDFMAATKFYAQFLPQTLPNVTVPRVNLPLANNFPMATNFPILSTFSAAKRYFAPYVFNSEYLSKYATSATPATTPLTAGDPLKSHISSNIATKSATCNRLNCTDCLRDYYSNLSHRIYSGPRSPLVVPDNKQLKSTAEIQLSTARSISLTTITNLNFGSAVATLPNKPVPSSGVMNPASNSAEEISYKCYICDKVFGCSQTLQAHEKTHKSPRYECADCGKGFSQLRNYKYHLSVHRGTKEFAAECTECGKTFNDKGYLSSHMKIHRNKKEYECPYCPKSFNQRVAFNMHVRIHTGVKPHKCAECGKRFSRKMLLKQHMRTHSGEKPYQCSVCGKSFADRSNMTLHHRLHSGIKPFSCPICPKAFTKKHHLKTHLNYHTGCKPYVCPHPNCNQAFTQSSNMRTHAKKCQYRPLQLGSYPVAVTVALPAVAAATTTNASMYFSPQIGKNATGSMRFGLSTSAASTTTTALTNLRRLAAPTTTSTATTVLYPMSSALPLRTTLRPF